MALYNTFLFGTGVVYGPAPLFDEIDPVTGPSTGGNLFTIDANGYLFSNAMWSSFFTGVGLDPLKFIDISAGTGTATTGAPNLVLSSGVAGGTGVIESVTSWDHAQAEALLYLTPISAYPVSEVEMGALTFYVDVNNYATLGLYLGASPGTLVLRAEVVRGGVVLSTKETEWTAGLSKLKILRWDTTLYFYAGGELFHTDECFVTTAAKYRLSCSNNLATTYVTSCRVQAFYWRPYVVFDGRPVHDATAVSNDRIRGIVPPSWDDKDTDAAYSGDVDVVIVGTSIITTVDAYKYYYVGQLTIINSRQSAIKVSLLSDILLKTPADSLRGLGVGK